ncbi:MAG: ABC transporter ATP-binding protein [Chloroflexi bacterium]|jgi:ABC-2 type transport system ATP-binding protein|nr:ABC transporter ATP-binding protein [Chloroflexota bacterium]
MEYAIHTEKLGRVYKLRHAKKEDPQELTALQDVNLQVKPGELFGLLGPNGAGKTTLIKILTTLLGPTSGIARVTGLDVTQEAQNVRARINMVSGGESSGYGLLTVRENLWMFSQFYGLPSKAANQRIDELLKIVGLEDRKNTKSSDLSTGLRQKMNIVRGFMTDPDVLFLDEPTLGLDVGASRDVRRFIRQWVDENRPLPQGEGRGEGRTLLLTTHYMVEADELCDRVAIINKGRVLACDTPANLKHGLQQDAIFKMTLSPLNGLNVTQLEALAGVKKVTHTPQDGAAELDLILESDDALGGLVTLLTSNDIHIRNLQKREPTLEDVFVDLVGHSMQEIEVRE